MPTANKGGRRHTAQHVERADRDELLCGAADHQQYHDCSGEMVVATLWHERTSFPATPGTGTLSGDMKALLQNMSNWITRVGRDVVLGLVAELPPDTTAEILGDSDPQRLAFIDELVDRA